MPQGLSQSGTQRWGLAGRPLLSSTWVPGAHCVSLDDCGPPRAVHTLHPSAPFPPAVLICLTHAHSFPLPAAFWSAQGGWPLGQGVPTKTIPLSPGGNWLGLQMSP